jgi:hypothetical protein
MSIPVGLNSNMSCKAVSLVLLCLLFVSALQVGELSHQHSRDDTAQHCLLCKLDSTSAIPDIPVHRAVLPRGQRFVPVALLAFVRSDRLSPPLRGPPLHT